MRKRRKRKKNLKNKNNPINKKILIMIYTRKIIGHRHFNFNF